MRDSSAALSSTASRLTQPCICSVNCKLGLSTSGRWAISLVMAWRARSMAPLSRGSTACFSTALASCNRCSARPRALAGSPVAAAGSGPAGASVRSAVQPRAAHSRSTWRSASAAMVSSGLTPAGPGSMAPSLTNRPSCTAVPMGPAKTRPSASTTPCVASSPMPQPPSGCTVTSLRPMASVLIGLGTKTPSTASAASARRRLSLAIARLSPAPGQSMRRRSSTRCSVPAASSTLITR